jgi:hypothetical protein
MDVAARRSDYKAPQPGVVVTVASESDVKRTVNFLVTTTCMLLDTKPY